MPVDKTRAAKPTTTPTPKEDLAGHLTDAYTNATGQPGDMSIHPSKLPSQKARDEFAKLEKQIKKEDGGGWIKAVKFTMGKTEWFAIASSLDGDDTDLRFYSKSGKFSGTGAV